MGGPIVFGANPVSTRVGMLFFGLFFFLCVRDVS